MMAMIRSAATWSLRNLGLRPFSLVKLLWVGCLLCLLLLRLGRLLHLFRH